MWCAYLLANAAAAVFARFSPSSSSCGTRSFAELTFVLDRIMFLRSALLIFLLPTTRRTFNFLLYTNLAYCFLVLSERFLAALSQPSFVHNVFLAVYFSDSVH